MEITPMFIVGLAVAVIVLLLLIVFLAGYVKAPPNTAFVISGIRKEPRFLIGRAGLCIPFLEQKNSLNLSVVKIDVNTSEAIPTADCIKVQVDANVNVQVDTESEVATENRKGYLQLAAKNFLDLDNKSIINIVQPVLEGNIREIVGKMKLKDMIGDRQQFAKLVSDNAAPDLRNMGLKLVSFNVQNFRDDVNGNGTSIIDDLGADNTEAIRKTAQIARANAQRDIKIAKALADNEANEAEVKANTIIAERNNALEIKQSDLKKASDTQKAVAAKAYEIEIAKQKKTINIIEAEAETAKQEKLIDVRKKEVDVTEQELEAKVTKPADAAKKASIIKAEGIAQAQIIEAEANKKTATINAEADLIAKQKSADAEKYKAETAAAAELTQKQKTADAERYNKEQEAEALKATAAAELVKQQKESEAKQYDQTCQAEGIKALAAANLESAQAEAKGIEAKGTAEGAAIAAKGLAEAEAKDKLADALKKYGEAALQDMNLAAVKELIHALPDIAANVAKPLAGVKEMKLYGEGNISQMTGDITKSMMKVIDGVQDATGLNVGNFLNSFLGAKAAQITADKKE